MFDLQSNFYRQFLSDKFNELHYVVGVGRMDVAMGRWCALNEITSTPTHPPTPSMS